MCTCKVILFNPFELQIAVVIQAVLELRENFPGQLLSDGSV